MALNSILDEIKPIGQKYKIGPIYYWKCKAGYWFEHESGEGTSGTQEMVWQLRGKKIENIESWWYGVM